MKLETLDDVLEQCVVDMDGCWLWTRAKDGHGYGVASFRGSATKVHRIAYEVEHKSVPLGLVVDHICRKRLCANVKHLRLLTRGQNVMADGSLSPSRKWADRTHCKNGHEYTAESTRRYKGVSGRRCIQCDRKRSRETKRKARGTAK